jgi:hypothetical protein
VVLLEEGVEDARVRQELVEELTALQPRLVSERDRYESQLGEALDLDAVLAQERLAMASPSR